MEKQPSRILPGKHRRKPLEQLEGDYEFAVNGMPRPDGAQEPEVNRIEVRITPDGCMVRHEWSLEWSFLSWDAAIDVSAAYMEGRNRGFLDGQLEALSRQGLKPRVAAKPETREA